MDGSEPAFHTCDKLTNNYFDNNNTIFINVGMLTNKSWAQEVQELSLNSSAGFPCSRVIKIDTNRGAIVGSFKMWPDS